MYNQFLPSVGPLPNQMGLITLNPMCFLDFSHSFLNFSQLKALFVTSLASSLYTCFILVQVDQYPTHVHLYLCKPDKTKWSQHSMLLSLDGWVPTGPFLFVNTNFQKEKEKKKSPILMLESWGHSALFILFCLLEFTCKFIFVEWKFSKFCCALQFSKVSYIWFHIISQ